MKGLFIGRFQPFHKGHLEALRQIKKECKAITIGIGSAQQKRTAFNPLSGGERITMVRRVIENRDIDSVEIYPIPDLDCHPAWPYYVEAILPKFEKVYGNSEVVLSLFDGIGHETGKIKQVKREKYSGNEIRKRIREEREWKHLVPEEVADYLEELDMDKRVKPTIEVRSETEKEAAHLLTKKDKTIATAESCTGGLIANRLTDVPGSSSYFKAGLVTYSNRAKEELLGVEENVIQKEGAVSSAVAEQMAEGIRKDRDTDLGLATTGIAGPGGGSDEKPIGTVYIALSSKEGTENRLLHFGGNRREVKEQISEKALGWIIENLKD